MRWIPVTILMGLMGVAGQAANAPEPELFLPGVVSTETANELTPSFTPDGAALFFQRWDGVWGGDPTSLSTILRSERRGDGWGAPEVAAFSGRFADGDPFVSPDGRYLYFTSDRPAPEKYDASDDIWRVLLPDGEPERLAPPIASGSHEYSPVVTASGDLYFASARPGGAGEGDLYVARRRGEGFDAPVPLGPAVNSTTGEWNLWVDANASTLVFEASSRPTNLSVPGDLYLSVRGPSGWTPGLPLAGLNTEGSDLMPRLSADGERLLFARAPLGGRASVRAAPWPAVRDETLAPLDRVLVVANRSSHDVRFVALRTGEVLKTLGVGRGPHLLSNVTGGRLVTTGYGIFPRPHVEPVAERPPFVEEPEPVLSVLDAAERRLLARWPIPGCAHPHASWIVGDRAFVTCEDERELAVIDLDTGEVAARHPTGGEGSHVLAWHEATRTIAVTNTESGSATLIDAGTGERSVIPLGSGSEGSLVVDERGELWVGNAGDGSISIVDLRERRETARLEGVCRMPIAMSRTSRRVWTACFAGRELVAVGIESRRVEARIALDGAPLNVLVHDAPERAPLAYASLPRDNAVAEIDLARGVETRRLAVGIEPDGLRWAGAAAR